MFWVLFIVPLVLVNLSASLLVSILFRWSGSSSIASQIALIASPLILAPSLLLFCWKFFSVRMDGYVDCLLLAFFSGLSLVIYYGVFLLFKNSVAAYLGLIVYLVALTFII